MGVNFGRLILFAFKGGGVGRWLMFGILRYRCMDYASKITTGYDFLIYTPCCPTLRKRPHIRLDIWVGRLRVGRLYTHKDNIFFLGGAMMLDRILNHIHTEEYFYWVFFLHVS